MGGENAENKKIKASLNKLNSLTTKIGAREPKIDVSFDIIPQERKVKSAFNMLGNALNNDDDNIKHCDNLLAQLHTLKREIESEIDAKTRRPKQLQHTSKERAKLRSSELDLVIESIFVATEYKQTLKNKQAADDASNRNKSDRQIEPNENDRSKHETPSINTKLIRENLPSIDPKGKEPVNAAPAVPSYRSAAEAANKINKIKTSTRESSSRRKHASSEEKLEARAKKIFSQSKSRDEKSPHEIFKQADSTDNIRRGPGRK